VEIKLREIDVLKRLKVVNVPKRVDVPKEIRNKYPFYPINIIL